jgi:hypothetical protein
MVMATDESSGSGMGASSSRFQTEEEVVVRVRPVRAVARGDLLSHAAERRP